LNKYKIILIDKNRDHIFTPNLYETASIVTKDCCNAALMNASIVIDTKDIINGKKIEFINDHIMEINAETKNIKTAGAQLNYEYLVLALGSETNYFNIPGAREYGFPLKTLGDAIKLREKIDTFFYAPEKTDIEIIIGGAGLTGVEIAGEFSHSLEKIKKLHRRQDISIKITLIEANSTILNGMPERIVAVAEKRLEKLGVKIVTNAKIKEATERFIIYEQNGNVENMPYSIFVWTAGIQANKLLEKLSLPKDPKNRIIVNEFMEATDNIFAIGDIAVNPTAKNPTPATAYIAEKEAKIAAENIYAKIVKKNLPAQGWSASGGKSFIPQIAYPFIIPIGGKFAIAHIKKITIKGYLGWIIKILVELNYLIRILQLRKAIKKWIKNVKIIIKND
ncbi:MAG: FAD-dependent oxidoreductase, partial [Patescibacteria group bacterium]